MSGAAALVFEALWFHQAAIALGNDVVAASCVLAAFMGGNALGGWLAPRLAQRARDRRRMLQLYAGVELLVGTVGLIIVHALPGWAESLAATCAGFADDALLLNAVRVLAALAALGAPAIAMGVTLPLLITATAPQQAQFGATLGVLYGANTLGAVAGVLMAELSFVPWLGIRGSAGAAFFACSALAIVAVLAARRSPEAPAISIRVLPPAEEHAAHADPSPAPIALAAGLCGFALLGLEGVWMRFLSLVLNDTPLAFALVLATVLAGIGLGGALAGAFGSFVKHIERFAGVLAALAGAFSIAGYLAYRASIESTFSFDQSAWTIALVCAPLVLPTCVLSGALYTLLGARLRATGDRELRAPDAEASGKLAFANTLGAALGALVTGLVLLPNAGIERSFLFLSGSYGVVALLLLPRSGASKRLLVAHAIAGVALIAGIALFPFGDVRYRFVWSSVSRWMGSEDRIAAVVEGRTATLVHVEHRANDLAIFDQIATNAYSMTVDDFAARRYMKLFAYLPTALNPKIERALIVGYGLGSTARAVLDNVDVKMLDIVDTEPKLLALAQTITPKAGTDPLRDPRAHVHYDDGRHYVQVATARGERYDLITGEPPPPIMAGVVNLYTREYFGVLKRALREGGMVSYWLPMMNISAGSGRSIIRAFCQVFDDCSLWHGSAKNFILLGSKQGPADALAARKPVSVDRFTRLFRTGALHTELASIGLEHPAQLGTLLIGDSRYLAKLVAYDRALVDDFPRRIAVPVNIKTRDQMLWAFRDTKAAHKRFAESSFVKQVFPPVMRQDALRRFEDIRLINDLMFTPTSPARQTAVLQQVLERTQLSFPVLLMLNSDPDVQAALRKLPPSNKATAGQVRHAMAGRLAARDYEGALRLLRYLDDKDLPLPGLREYVQGAARRADQGF